MKMTRKLVGKSKRYSDIKVTFTDEDATQVRLRATRTFRGTVYGMQHPAILWRAPRGSVNDLIVNPGCPDDIANAMEQFCKDFGFNAKRKAEGEL